MKHIGPTTDDVLRSLTAGNSAKLSDLREIGTATSGKLSDLCQGVDRLCVTLSVISEQVGGLSEQLREIAADSRRAGS